MPIRKSGRALTDRPAVRLALVTLASVIMAVNIKSFVEAGGLFPGGFNGLTLLIQRSLQQFAGVTLPFSLINCNDFFFVLITIITIHAPLGFVKTFF